MTYILNIPASTDYQDQTQSQIQGNFNSIGAFFNPDSQTFLTPIYLNSQLAPPAGAPAVADPGQVGIWCNTGVTSTLPELWYCPQNGAGGGTNTVGPIAFTESVQDAAGWTASPSGIIYQWGTATITNPATAVPFTKNFPNNCFSVMITEQIPGVNAINHNFISVVAGSLNVATFIPQARNQGGGLATTNIYWLAIGN